MPHIQRRANSPQGEPLTCMCRAAGALHLHSTNRCFPHTSECAAGSSVHAKCRAAHLLQLRSNTAAAPSVRSASASRAAASRGDRP
jgi:hypothetical protein